MSLVFRRKNRDASKSRPSTDHRAYIAKPIHFVTFAATPEAAISATKLATEDMLEAVSRASSSLRIDGGPTALAKPSLAASFNLRPTWPTERTAPESAISPK